MNGVNGIILSKDGKIHLNKKKQHAPRVDDPELMAEIRYAKENGLEIPKALALETVAPVERRAPRMLSQRNRSSKSTSDVKSGSPPPKVKASKADRKLRSRGVSGSYSRKDETWEYGFDYDLDSDADVVVEDDDEDTYEDVVYKFDSEKVRGALSEYFSNGDVECAMSDLDGQLYNNDSVLRLTKEIIRNSLDYDESRVALGYKLVTSLLKSKSITEKAIHAAVEDLLLDLDDLQKDMPRAREFLAVFIAKTVADGVMSRIVFDDTTSKLNANRQAMSCALEVYMYLNNRPLLNGKFADATGAYEPLDTLGDRMDKILQEFLLSCDYAEVAERLRHIHTPHYSHQLVYLVGVYAIEKMNENLMNKLAKLLKYLIDTGFLLDSSLKPGFNKLYESLNEIYIDVPAAFSLCEKWVKKCDEVLDLDESIIESLPKPSGKRSRTLSESDPDGKLAVIDDVDDTPSPIQQNGVCV